MRYRRKAIGAVGRAPWRLLKRPLVGRGCEPKVGEVGDQRDVGTRVRRCSEGHIVRNSVAAAKNCPFYQVQVVEQADAQEEECNRFKVVPAEDAASKP